MSIRVKCTVTDYYIAQRFETTEAAQAWIDRLEQHREQVPALCAGPHAIVTLTPKESHDNAQT